MRYGRERGKKFTTWRIDVHGKTMQVEVRSVDNDSQFWVSIPGLGIDMVNSDLVALKSAVEVELSKQQPIEWTDYLSVTIEDIGDDFPRLVMSSCQRGIDDAGNEYHRLSSDEQSRAGWPEERSMRNSRSEVVVYVKDTDDSKKAIRLLEQAMAACFEQLLQLFRIKHSGTGYNFKAEVNEAAVAVAIARIAKSGLAIDVHVKD
jgi:hypothetical protein